MKIFNLSLAIVSILCFAGFTITGINAQNGAGTQLSEIFGASDNLYIVNDNGDSNDINVGDAQCLDANGKCTLRAAIEESNFCCISNVISFELPSASVINLTLGELRITKLVQIVGPGSSKLTIQRSFTSGTPNFRIFNIATPAFLPAMLIRGLKIKNGKTDGDGGGIYIQQGSSVQLTDLAVSNNSAARGGGIASDGTLKMTRSLVNSNTATKSFGGGISTAAADMSAIITDTTLTNNSALAGGSIHNSGDLLLVNNTISHNSVTNQGGSVFNFPGGNVFVLNTIIGMDDAPNGSSLSGAFNSLGNNLVTDARNSGGFTNGVNGDQVSNNNTINPLLGNLAENGGPTETRALLQGSPAIDHGNNCVIKGFCPEPLAGGFKLLSDQRTGYQRLAGISVDVGAYEKSAITTSGSLYLGVISSAGTRLANSLALLIKASDGERLLHAANPFSATYFTDLKIGEVYIFGRISKRASDAEYWLIFEFDDIPTSLESNFKDQRENIKITINK